MLLFVAVDALFVMICFVKNVLVTVMDKINGYALPVKDIITIGAAVFWLAGLSFQVNANGDKIQEQAETKERLVRIEERVENTREDIREIKTEQEKQDAKLDKILEKVSE